MRLRLEYDLVGRSLQEDNEGRLWFWVTFASGTSQTRNVLSYAVMSDSNRTGIMEA